MFACGRGRRGAATCAPGCHPLARTDRRSRRAGHSVWRDAPGAYHASSGAVQSLWRFDAEPRPQTRGSAHRGLDAVPRSIWIPQTVRRRRWRSLDLTLPAARGRRAPSRFPRSLQLWEHRTDTRGSNSRTPPAMVGCRVRAEAGRLFGLHHDAARQPGSDADRLLNGCWVGRSLSPGKPRAR